MKNLVGMGLFLGVAIGLGGCATYEDIKPAPAEQQAVGIVYSNEGPSGWTDLPIGAYRIPNSQVIVSGYQGPGIGMAFGVLGVLMQDSIETSEGKGKVKNAQGALHINLTSEAQDDTASLLKGTFANSFVSGESAGATLTVVPYVVVTYVNDSDVRPFVILKTELRHAGSSKPVWTSRYIASEGGAVPLEGDHSYTSDGGALLKQTLSDDLSAGIRFMLADISAPQARASGKSIYVETSVPFARQRFGLVGPQIAEDDHWLVFVPKVADAVVFSGVDIVDKSAVTSRPATADDKIKLLDDKSEKK